MDAAQMLTAQEIARQCEQLARVAEQRASETVPEAGAVTAQPAQERTSAAHRGRHLRLADPITQPIERITDPSPDREPDLDTDPDAFHTQALTSRERGMLAFERQWWKRAGAKERAVRELFDMSSSRYYQVLNALIDKPEALRADPMLVKRLRRVRQSRQQRRNAGGSGTTHRETEH